MKKSENGQGLVEFSLMSIFLIVLLLGMAEVCWLFRASMELHNNAREIARYAARNSRPDHVEAYANTLMRDTKEWAVQLSYFTATITSTTSISHTIGTIDTTFPIVDSTSFVENEQVIMALYESLPDFDYPLANGLQVIVVDAIILQPQLMGFFGKASMPLRSRAVFRVITTRNIYQKG